MNDAQLAELKPLIFWEGFPPCGLMIKQVADLFGEHLVILGTRPAVPFEGLEAILGHHIEWLKHPDDIWERREEFADRKLIVHTGWAHKGWLRFDRWMKQRGARVVTTVDNQFKGNLRQWAGAVWFRIWLRQHFDAALVPGRSATRLVRFLGMPAERVFTGYYGAYEGIYTAGPRLAQRRKEFLFVGQLIQRKGVDVLLQAFRLYRAQGGDWNLRILGSGPYAKECEGDGIIFTGFGQARAVAQQMQESRCLVLPSREDHWPTVVCESIASGMAVIASRWVGSAEDLIRNGLNGRTIQHMSAIELCDAFFEVSSWSESKLDNAQQISLGLAAGYRSSSYASALEAIVACLRPEQRSLASR